MKQVRSKSIGLSNHLPKMRYWFIAIVAFCISVFGADDGHNDWPASLGRATSAASDGALSFHGNPAGAAAADGWSAGFFTNREWGLNELATFDISGRMAFPWGTIAAGGSFFGERELYSEACAGALYAKRIWRVDTGIRARLLSVSSGDWSASTAIIGLGVRAPIIKTLDAGAWIDNIAASKLDGNQLPVRGALGAAFRPTDWLRLSCDLYSESPNPSTLRIGQEILIGQILSVRSGVTFRPNCYHFGLGINFSDFEFTWAYIGHPELCGSTQLGIIYGG